MTPREKAESALAELMIAQRKFDKGPKKSKPALGKCWPDAIGRAMRTGYHRFARKDGVGGLAKTSTDGKRVNVLAVESGSPGQGNFRQFIDDLKRAYKEVFVWSVWNPLVMEKLLKYGFARVARLDSDGSAEFCMGWIKGGNPGLDTGQFALMFEGDAFLKPDLSEGELKDAMFFKKGDWGWGEAMRIRSDRPDECLLIEVGMHEMKIWLREAVA